MSLPLRASDFPGISQNGLAFLQTLANELNTHTHGGGSHTHTENTAAAYTQNATTAAATVTTAAPSGVTTIALDSSVSAVPAT